MPTRILIVEDEAIIAKGIEKCLKSLGYDVAGLAFNGESAIEKAGSLRPELILMDVHLGKGMDGVAAAAAIRDKYSIPVVYLTAHSDESTLQRAKLAEPFGYILKPYDETDLRIAVEIGVYKHRMERRQRENDQWLAATLSSIGDGVIATDEQGRVRFMNSVAEKLTAWAQDEAKGKSVETVFAILDPRSRAPVPNPSFAALRSGECATLAKGTLLVSKDGTELPIDDSAAPIRDVDSKIAGSVLVFRDVTERCRLEEHLRQAQKMEALGRLAGGIAHDFNNLMTVITGYSELMLLQPGEIEDNRDHLRQILKASERAASLTQQILAFSRKQVLVPTILSLNAIVHDMAAMVKRLIGAHIEFVLELAADAGLVRADPMQLGQVILNLAANANDAMPEGGKLVFSTSCEEIGPLGLGEMKPGRCVLLTVADTGCGMPEEVLACAFDPFFTTKGVGRGTGLGLAAVHGFVAQSGGHIEVSSRVGFGTTFRIRFPLAEGPGPVLPRDEEVQSAGGNETLLLVEDDDAIRKLARQTLRSKGYAVLEAATGKQGEAVAEGHDGPIHLLITDLVMPLLGGRLLAERVTRSRPGTRVLFLSGYTSDEIDRQGVDSTSANFLHKPFKLADLVARVREILDRP